MARGSVNKRTLADGSVRYDAIADLGPDPVSGKRRQRWKTFSTRRDAEKALALWLSEIERGIAVDRSTKTVGEYLTYWLETSARHRVRASTFDSYQRLVGRYIIPSLGSVPLQKLSPAQVQAFYSSQLTGTGGRSGTGLSPRSVRYLHALLHRALKEALALGLVARNVTEAVAPPKAVRPQIQSWDVAEAQQFLDVAQGDCYSPVWLIALHTGMRRGELLGLRWQDVDLDRSVLYVRQAVVQVGRDVRISEPKTASGRRTIALDPQCIAALRGHRARQLERRLALGRTWQDTGLVFTNELGGVIDPMNLYHRFIKLTVKAGLPRIPLHGLRHTHATILMKHGVHPKVASERLGHSDITLTLSTYSHVLPQMQQEAASIFASAMASGGT
jgi:integrase